MAFRVPSVLAGFVFCICLSACNSGNNNPTAQSSDSASNAAKDAPMASIPDLKPAGPKPAWAPDSIDDNMQLVIEKLATYGDPPIESVDAQKARTLHTPADAVMDVMKENNVPMPAAMCDTMGKEIPVSGGSIHARVYTPKNGAGPFPLIVHYHGGGWVIATIDTYDASAKGLCEGAGAVVVAVEYRKGPEHKFPTAHNDAFAAYQWAVQNAASLKADPKTVAEIKNAVAGETGKSRRQHGLHREHDGKRQGRSNAASPSVGLPRSK